MFDSAVPRVNCRTNGPTKECVKIPLASAQRGVTSQKRSPLLARDGWRSFVGAKTTAYLIFTVLEFLPRKGALVQSRFSVSTKSKTFPCDANFQWRGCAGISDAKAIRLMYSGHRNMQTALDSGTHNTLIESERLLIGSDVVASNGNRKGGVR